MEELDGRGEANVKVIEGLLRESFNGADVKVTNSRLDGRKFVIATEKKMLLCVSREYLNDQNESRVRSDFDHYRVARTLTAHPGEYFLLCNKGMQPIPASDATS